MPLNESKAQESIINLIQMLEKILGWNYTKEELKRNTQTLFCNMKESDNQFILKSSGKSPKKNSFITLDDFDIIKILLRGTYGKVMMV